MNITKYVPKSVTRAVANQTMAMKQNSPHIFFGVGLTAIAAGTVMACRATLKSEPVLDEMRADIEGVKQNLDGDRRDLAYVYGKGTLKLAQQYAPAIAVSGIGVACLTGAHVQLTRRNTALTVAYAGLHRAFDEYRQRIRDHLGEEEERGLYHGGTKKKAKVDGEKVELLEFDGAGRNPYSVLFDETSTEWQKDPEYNEAFLRAVQHQANIRLQAVGYLYLNDILHDLGLPRTKTGQVVGWDRRNPTHDGYVDFGLYNPENARFTNHDERSVWLDFNVDGLIWGVEEE